MSRGKVLVVEDDPAIRRGVLDALRFEGFEVTEASNGRAGLDAALTSDCQLVLLDLVMPEMDGLQVLGELRKSRPTLPVIILTARGEESDRVRGLKLGADDYVVKPFSVKELLARAEAVLRRSPERPNDVSVVKVPAGEADLARREVRFSDGQRQELSEREADLLRYLVTNPGRAVSRDEILQRVWRISPQGVETRTIDMCVVRLREKLRDDPEKPKILLTVRGKGYMYGNDS